MKSNIKRLSGAALLVGLIALTGCGSAPPECSDAKVAETIGSMAVDNAREAIQQLQQYADDPAQIKEGYYKELKTRLVQVVTDGYDKDAKKRSCQANLTFTTVTGRTLSRDIRYRTQVTEDKGGGFVVSVTDFEPFVRGVLEDLIRYYVPKRYSGDWRGSYACQGIDGASSGPQGPFSMEVTLIAEPPKFFVPTPGSPARLERSAQGGGFEKLTGLVTAHGVELEGEGQNSPDDIWETSFKGQVEGHRLTARGEIKTPDGEVLRKCSLNLTQEVSSVSR